MAAKDLFDSGDLSGALEQANQDVRANPRELKSRIFLFELLCFAGDLQRAERQLDAIAQTSGDIKVEMGVQIYQSLLQAERARRAFFDGGRPTPKFFAEPPVYTSLHLDAAAKIRDNEISAAEQMLAESRQAQNPVRGRADGQAFADFHDGDDLLAPYFEVFFQRDYYWVPIDHVSRLEIAAPKTLRDLLWMPAKLHLHHRPLGEVFIPVLYFGSHIQPDDRIKLGRMTDWKTMGDNLILGTGQRTYFADETERPMLEIRIVELAPSA